MLHLDALEPRRLLTVYRPDLDWGADGFVRATSDTEYLRPLALQDDGKLLYRTNTGTVRLNADGTQDSSFSRIAGNPNTTEIFRLPSGRLIASDSPTQAGGFVDPVLRSFEVNGETDSRFGAAGRIVVALPTSPIPGTRISSLQVIDVAETPGSGLYVLVRASARRGSLSADAANVLLKLNRRGKLDTWFAGTGMQVIPGEAAKYAKLGFDARGRISVGGIVGFDTLQVHRFEYDGTPDLTLSIDTNYDRIDSGADWSPDVEVPFGFGRDGSFYYNDLHLNAAGEIDFGGVRHRDETGALDPSYGRSGWLRTHVLRIDQGYIIASQGDRLYRYDPAGVRDTIFGGSDGVELLPDDRTDLSLAIFGRREIVGGFAGGMLRLAPRERMLLREGTLHVSGSNGDDLITIRQLDAQIRVQVGDQARRIRTPIQRIDAALGDGDNTLFSDVDLPTTVIGGRGFDAVTTGDADDVISLHYGVSQVYSGGGFDQVTAYGPASIDLGDGGARVSADTSATTSITSRGGHTIMNLRGFRQGQSSPRFVLRIDGGRHRIASEGAIVDLDIQSRFGSIIDVSGDNSTLRGGNGPDRITAGGSLVDARDGDDVIHTIGGTLQGGAGNDTVVVDRIGATVFGDDGDDTLTGGRANDRIYGGAGNDRVVGLQGNDILYGDSGDDFIDSTDPFINSGYYDYADGGADQDNATASERDELVNIESVTQVTNA